MKRTILVLLGLAVFLIGFTKLANYDIWYHLSIARYMLERQAMPADDPFSYTATGGSWIGASWITQLIFYGLYLMGGPNALIIFKALFLVITFYFVYLTMERKGAHFFASVLVLLLAIAVSKDRFHVRPHIVSLFFLALYGYILSYSEHARLHSHHVGAGRAKESLIWALLPLQLLWANMHSENLFGVIFVGLYLFLSQGFLLTRSKKFLLTGGLALLTLANPLGWDSYFSGITHLSKTAFKTYIVELQPVHFSPEFFAFWLFFVVGLFSLFINRNRCLRDILIFACFSCLAIKTRRFRPEFAILVAPAVASSITAGFARFAERWRLKVEQKTFGRNFAYTCVAIFVAFFAVSNLGKRGDMREFGSGVNEDLLPGRAAEFIKRENVEGNMFNSMALGGYLIWSLYPERRVFMDGRTGAYGPDLLDKEVNYYRPGVWEGLMKDFNFDYAVVSNMDPLGLYPCKYLDSQRKKWALVLWDDACILYLKREGKNSRLAEEYGYSYVQPNNPDLTYMDAYLGGPRKKEAIIAELGRCLALDPGCFTAHASLAYIYAKEGDYAKAGSHLVFCAENRQK